MKINGCDAGHIKQANMKELLEANIVAIQETGLSGKYELVVNAGHHIKCIARELDPYFSARRKTGTHKLCYAWHCNVTNHHPAKYCLSTSKKAESLPPYAFVTDAPTDDASYRGSLTILSTQGRYFPAASCRLVENPDGAAVPNLANQVPETTRSRDEILKFMKQKRQCS